MEHKFKNTEDEIAQFVAVSLKLQEFAYNLGDFCHICILFVIYFTCFFVQIDSYILLKLIFIRENFISTLKISKHLKVHNIYY